jgi:hypothetical protein
MKQIAKKDLALYNQLLEEAKSKGLEGSAAYIYATSTLDNIKAHRKRLKSLGIK